MAETILLEELQKTIKINEELEHKLEILKSMHSKTKAENEKHLRICQERFSKIDQLTKQNEHLERVVSNKQNEIEYWQGYAAAMNFCFKNLLKFEEEKE